MLKNEKRASNIDKVLDTVMKGSTENDATLRELAHAVVDVLRSDLHILICANGGPCFAPTLSLPLVRRMLSQIIKRKISRDGSMLARALKAPDTLAAKVIVSPHLTKLVLRELREHVLYGRATLAQNFDSFLVSTVDYIIPAGDPDSFPADLKALVVEVDDVDKPTLVCVFAMVPFKASRVRSPVLDKVYDGQPNTEHAAEVHEAFQESPTRQFVTARLAAIDFIVEVHGTGNVDTDGELQRLLTPLLAWDLMGLFGHKRQIGSSSPWPASTSRFASTFNVEVSPTAETHAVVMALLKVTDGELCALRALLRSRFDTFCH